MKRFTSATTADQYKVKEHNLSILLDQIWYASSPISRSKLKKLSGLNKMTVCNLVAQLEEWQMVQERGIYQPSHSGRPGILYEINPDCGLIIGVEIGIRKINLVLTNFKGEILWRTHCNVDCEADDEFVQTESMIYEALKKAQSYDVRILGIGVAVAALVSNEGQISLLPGSLSPTRAYSAAEWEQKFNLPVFVTNDGNASAVGEQILGDISESDDDFIFVNSGDGLGAGIISNGDLFSGVGGFAGEIGHMTIQMDGSRCKCGNLGCWENYVSLTAAIEYWTNHPQFKPRQDHLQLTGDTSEDFRSLVKAARAGDTAAKDALVTVGNYLGIGLANIVNIFNPRHIFLGGQLCQGQDFFMERLLNILDQRCFKIALENLEKVAVVKDPLDISVMGAVALVIREVIRNPTRWKPEEEHGRRQLN